MKKTSFILAFLLGCIGLSAQNYHIRVHNTGFAIYDKDVNTIEDMRFDGSHMFINDEDGGSTLNIREIDSITFYVETAHTGDTVYITYNGNSVLIDNPFSNDGVTVTTNSADVTVNSYKDNVPYVVSGTSANGSLTITTGHEYYLILKNLNLTSGTTAAINSTTGVAVHTTLVGTSSIADYAYSAINGAFYVGGNMVVDGSGTLNVTGNAKHGISVENQLRVNSGTIRILDSDSDGIHGGRDLLWNGGTLDIVSAGSDGLDFSLDVTIHNGDLTINTTAESQRCIKVSGIFTMNDGSLTLNTSGQDSKGIKCDSIVNIAGGILTIEHSGDISKGIKSDGEINVTGGEINITASGSTILEVVNNQNVPSYCTAIKCDTDINISGGTFNITLPTSNHGGKSISADGNLTISGGDFTITTQGDGATYTISGNNKDAYTSSCLKCEGNMELLGGTFNLTSTGRGGKGINVGGTLVIGTEGGNNDDLNLNVTTSGERITITAGGGGPWGGGDYANPKAIKSQGNLTIHSGTIVSHCNQTQNEGGECIESKGTLIINGGNIEAISVKDDAVNAAQNITINGGTYYAHSDGNDGTDSNGTLFINGGFNISNGARQPEEGFDCDNNQFKITGSTSIGTGGGTSGPTLSVCTQPSVRINTQPGYAIQVLKSDGTVICTFQCPTFTSGGGGGGWGNSMVMLFTDPQLEMGNTYTIKYGGTISGGTEWHGYYTGNVTYSGGQSTTYTVNSMFSSVNAGGGGW